MNTELQHKLQMIHINIPSLRKVHVERLQKNARQHNTTEVTLTFTCSLV